MAHGQPDYGMYAQKKTVFGVSDVGELAARLGSPCTYDRRGDVIFIEDFSLGLNRWHVQKTSTGSDAAIVNDRFRTGGTSCKVTTGTDNSGAINLLKCFPLPVFTSVGVEFSISRYTNATAWQLIMNLYDGVDVVTFSVHYDYDTKLFRMEKSDGGWLDLGLTYPPYDEQTMFNTVKLVGDYSTNKYKRAMFDSFVVDLSEYAGYVAANAGDPRFEILLQFYGDAPDQGYFWIADVIFTQNEP